MKKIAVALIFIIAFITTFVYFYYNYKRVSNVAKSKNIQYTSYYEREITGTELATLINKSIDNNKSNNVEVDEKGKYKNNEENSIQIDISFLDDEKVHSMEEIFNKDTDKFVELYGTIKFKCTKIEYHKKTSQVSYMYIEQISI